jgi:hypothetical protein
VTTDDNTQCSQTFATFTIMPSQQLHARKRVVVGQPPLEQQEMPPNVGAAQQQQQQHQLLSANSNSGKHSDLEQQQQHHQQQQLQQDDTDLKEHTRSSLLSRDIRAAVTAVLSFLSLGLCFSFFLLHHQHRKVVLHIMRNPWAHGGAVLRGRAGFHHHFYTGAPRFVTVVLPSVVNAPGRTRRLTSIQQTWGPYARAVYVVHNVTEFPSAKHAVLSETSKPEDTYAFPQLLLVPPQIHVEDGVPRLKYVIQTILHRVNPDFAFFVNDHTFVIPEHLCYFLERQDPKLDMYAGHALRHDNIAFNSGAAGYILSRSSMQKLVDAWHDDDSKCGSKHQHTPWLQSNPGLVSAQCLHTELHIPAIDTRHSNHHNNQKSHRFHAYPLTRLVAGKYDDWYINKHKDLENIIHVDSSYANLLSGEDCCAEDSISFHYVEHLESKSLFATRSALLKDPTMSDHELKSFMKKEWPNSWNDVGGYSQPLPEDHDSETWKFLLAVIRKISSRHTQRDC